MTTRLFFVSAERVILLALTVLLVSVAGVAQPVITLSISSGPPTTKLLVSGTGYDPYVAVDVFFDTQDKALAVTDGDGAFGKIGITVPGSAKPGGHWISGVERYKGLVGQSRFLVNTNWVEFQFSPSHTGVNPYENVLSRRNVGNLSLDWKYNTGNASASSSPAVVNAVVYVGSSDHDVYALYARSGTLLWKYHTDGYVASSPAVVNGVIYFGSDYGYVYALNARTGALLWRFSTDDSINSSSPAVSNGVVYICSTGLNFGVPAVYALNASTGTLLWSYIIGTWMDFSPAVVNGVVYAGSGNGSLYALNATDGSLRWSYPTLGVEGSLAVSNGVVYFGSYGTFYALNASTGDLLWSHTGVGESFASAVGDGVVYVASNGIYALNASTGALLWKYNTGNYSSAPALANGVLFFGSDDYSVYALNASTGTLLWKYTTEKWVWHPAVANGVVYVGSADGNLYAFDLTGSVSETASLPPNPHTLVPDLRLKEFDAGRKN